MAKKKKHAKGIIKKANIAGRQVWIALLRLCRYFQYGKFQFSYLLIILKIDRLKQVAS